MRKTIIALSVIGFGIAGLTEVSPGTKTVGFVGPDYENKIDKLVGQLKLY